MALLNIAVPVGFSLPAMGKGIPPVGAHEIVLEVTDDDGYTAGDSLWGLVLAPGGNRAAVQLDLSGGFNMDLWLGPLEMAALDAYAAGNPPGLSLRELQGDERDGLGWNALSTSWLICGDAPAWEVSGTEGTPAGGYLSGDDFDYFLASAVGNPVLPGDWLEVADPGDNWDVRPNALVVQSWHDTSLFQVAEAVAELPDQQKSNYVAINFVVAAHVMSDRARYMTEARRLEGSRMT
ncbi:MAG: hypothetical protein GWP05_05200 [Anaerolineaceae bacterium]|nr:hypothetical protein [Anaerolineaceae bacterium]